jgi:hypothetical protein
VHFARSGWVVFEVVVVELVIPIGRAALVLSGNFGARCAASPAAPVVHGTHTRADIDQTLALCREALTATLDLLGN